MNYNGTIYRPPIEANTFLIPVTEGCSHNTCTYCNMFSGIPFRPLPLSDIKGYLHEVDERYHDFLVRQERVYLVGGDPFVLSAAKLRALSEVIRRYLPKVGTISMYASIANIQRKSDAELAALRDAGVNDLYIGVESALSDVLLFLNKGTSAEDAREQLLRLNAAKIRHIDLYMPGAAGKGRARESALAKAALINETRPSIVGEINFSVFPGTKLAEDIAAGVFWPAGERECFVEKKLLLENLTDPDLYYWSSHVLDAFPLQGRLGDARGAMIRALDQAILTADDEATTNRTGRTGMRERRDAEQIKQQRTAGRGEPGRLPGILRSCRGSDKRKE